LIAVRKTDKALLSDLLDFVEFFAHVVIRSDTPNASDDLLICPEGSEAVVAVMRTANKYGRFQLRGNGFGERGNFFVHALLVEVEPTGSDLAFEHLQAHLSRLLAVLAVLNTGETVLALNEE
jgi:hypothetical protein